MDEIEAQLRGGPFAGLTFRRPRPAAGDIAETFLYCKKTRTTHLYRQRFNGRDRVLILDHAGTVAAPVCPVQKHLLGEG